jgi:hypothetical protein
MYGRAQFETEHIMQLLVNGKHHSVTTMMCVQPEVDIPSTVRVLFDVVVYLDQVDVAYLGAFRVDGDSLTMFEPLKRRNALVIDTRYRPVSKSYLWSTILPVSGLVWDALRSNDPT